MRNLILAAAAVALLAAPSLAFAAATNTTAAKPKAAVHYDCTKKGNANKAECKAAAAAATPAPAVTPTPVVKPAPSVAAVKPAAVAPAVTPAKPAAAKPAAAKPAGTSKLAICAKQWDSYTTAQKDAYKAKAEGKLSAKGHKLSGYNVFTSECMKK